MAKYNEVEPKPTSVSVITPGTIISGDIDGNGDIRFDGTLTGNLSTSGKLVVGETGSVKGEIKCSNSVVEGKVEGKITVNDLLTLKSTARVLGDIEINRLAIEPGCKFSGNCKMTDEVKAEEVSYDK
jgi:cytoskeletal protein CcmA (bactofilin family)